MNQNQKTDETVQEPTKTKTKRRIFKKVALALIVGGTVALLAVACGHGMQMSEAMMRKAALNHVDDLMDEINATDEQAQRFEALTEEILGEVLAMKKAHKTQAPQVLTELRKATPNREVLHNALDAHFDAVEELAHSSLDKILTAYETLDANQKQIVVEKLANHMENH